MKVTLLLCDFVQASPDGKLHIIGGGWSIKGADAPMGLAIKVDVPWVEANRRHAWQLELLDADGQPVLIETATGQQPLRIESPFEVGRPSGLPEGMELALPVAINFGVVPLPPEQRFEWRISIDGETREDWRVAFTTAASGPPQGPIFGDRPV